MSITSTTLVEEKHLSPTLRARGMYLRRLRETASIPGGLRAQVEMIGYGDTGDERRPVIVSDEPLARQTVFTNVPNVPREPAGASDTPARPVIALLEARALGERIVHLRIGSPDWMVCPRDFGMLAPGALETLEEAAAPEGSALTLESDPFAVRLGPVETPLDDRNVHGLLTTPPPGILLTERGPEAFWSWALTPDERLYGLGEHFTRLDHRGEHLTLWNTDAWGTTTDSSYKYVPFLHSSRGYGLFFHTPAPVTLSLGTPSQRAAVARVGEPGLDLFLILGENPEEILYEYTRLTGRATMPPRWAFGVWYSRCRYQTRAEVESVAERVRAEDLPGDVLHIDPAWLAQPGLNCDFQVNESAFPDLPGMVRNLGKQGFKISLWELPYITVTSPRYSEGAERGYFLKDAEGQPICADFGGPAPDGKLRAVLDFTNPAAKAWWQDLHRPLLKAGVAVFKSDFGEGVPLAARAYNGMTGYELRNLYPLLYNAAVHEVITQETGRPGMVWGRSGWAGTQRYPAQWGGDPKTDAWSMLGSLRGGLNMALSAPGLWSHDIGGFYGPSPSPTLYTRWAQFGLLSPLARAHGTTPREPWEFGPEALATFRRFARLRVRLNPYLYNLAWQAHTLGLPLLRPLLLAYPDDLTAASVDDHYLLGPDLLVVPIFSEQPGPVERRFYLPGDAWVRLECDDNGMLHAAPEAEAAGGRWYTRHTADVLFYLRRGAVLPLGPLRSHLEDAPPEEITLLYGAPGDTPTAAQVIWDASGSATSITLQRDSRRDDGTLLLSISGSREVSWRARSVFSLTETNLGRVASLEGTIPASW